ncbi:hypothetical protein TMRO357_01542 [Alteriqipengyuania sp. 357]
MVAPARAGATTNTGRTYLRGKSFYDGSVLFPRTA